MMPSPLIIAAVTPALWPILPPVGLGLLAVYLLLPRARPYPPLWGAAAGALALLLAGALVVRAGAVTPEALLFYAFSAVAVVAGTLLVTQSNPARAALAFALVVLSTCGLFLLQAAPFLAAATTIIYAGAIIVIFLFVLMLAQQEGLSDADQRSREPLLAAVAGFVLLGAVLYVLRLTYGTPPELDGLLRQTERAVNQIAPLRQRADADELTGDDLRALARDAGAALREVVQVYSNFNNAETGPAARLGNAWPQYRPLFDAVSNAEASLRRQAGDLEKQPPDNPDDLKSELAEAHNVLTDVVQTERQVRNTLGSLQPQGGQPSRLSDLSGPRASEPYDRIRRDEYGRPQMPAENVAYLGRSLFTDYLLAVELGGTLLLVATIGAIAIATRRAEVRP
jgi:NADH:ubiquinone oxidoreductase subunit 6 (subunit J)